VILLIVSVHHPDIRLGDEDKRPPLPGARMRRCGSMKAVLLRCDQLSRIPTLGRYWSGVRCHAAGRL